MRDRDHSKLRSFLRRRGRTSDKECNRVVVANFEVMTIGSKRSFPCKRNPVGAGLKPALQLRPFSKQSAITAHRIAEPQFGKHIPQHRGVLAMTVNPSSVSI